MTTLSLPRTARPRAGRVVLGSDPRWARPALLLILALAAVLYAWGLSGYANEYYSAAVRSGTQSWKAFFFGSLDAGSFITVDKPPMALWVQELFARLFGFGTWSLLLPSVLMGVAAVLVLYATVRRAFGPVAGLIAALVMTLTPITVAIDKDNNPDTLLVLLLVLAAWAAQHAIASGRLPWLLASAFFLGCGFNTKMLQAYLLLPALFFVALFFGRGGWPRRLVSLLCAGIVLAVSSFWWMVVVDLIPKSSRPYIGGSTDNTVWDLVIGYNGLGRVTGGRGPGGGGLGGGGLGGGQGPSFAGASGPGRLFNAIVGGQISWLLPFAALALVAGVVSLWRRPRTDLARAAVVLWGGWLVVHFVVFSFASGTMHPYYTTALAPAIGALTGIGAVLLFGAYRRSRAWAWVLPLGVAVTGTWSFALLRRSPSWHPWLPWAVAALTLLTTAGLLTAHLAETVRGRPDAAGPPDDAAQALTARPDGPTGSRVDPDAALTVQAVRPGSAAASQHDADQTLAAQREHPATQVDADQTPTASQNRPATPTGSQVDADQALTARLDRPVTPAASQHDTDRALAAQRDRPSTRTEAQVDADRTVTAQPDRPATPTSSQHDTDQALAAQRDRPGSQVDADRALTEQPDRAAGSADGSPNGGRVESPVRGSAATAVAPGHRAEDAARVEDEDESGSSAERSGRSVLRGTFASWSLRRAPMILAAVGLVAGLAGPAAYAASAAASRTNGSNPLAGPSSGGFGMGGPGGMPGRGQLPAAVREMLREGRLPGGAPPFGNPPPNGSAPPGVPGTGPSGTGGPQTGAPGTGGTQTDGNQTGGTQTGGSQTGGTQSGTQTGAPGTGGTQTGGSPTSGTQSGTQTGVPGTGGTQNGVPGTGGTRGGEIGSGAGGFGSGGPQGGPGGMGQVSSQLIAYLEKNRGGATWLLAVPSAQNASSIIIQTGQAVMAMGGFTGSDPAMTVERLQAYVRAGKLHYVMTGGGGPGGGGSAVTAWVSKNCSAVKPAAYGVSSSTQSGQTVYRCG